MWYTQREGEIVIRRAARADAEAIRRVAQLDSRPVPPGPHVIAEAGGEIRAALSLSDGTVIADPFQPTTQLVEMLRVGAREAESIPQPSGRRITGPRLAVASAIRRTGELSP